jgi:hypothetical protein
MRIRVQKKILFFIAIELFCLILKVMSNEKGETKMSFYTLKKLFLFLLFLFLPLIVFSQSNRTQSVALVPFWGSDDQFIKEFGEELYKGVNSMQGFRPVVIDMTNLPDDVPEGGFPPYICPSPSLIKTNPLALTGELTADPDDDEFWHLRLYLWEMNDTRLVFSDELTAYDREECAAGLPGMLEWLFSWLTRGGSGSGSGAAGAGANQYGPAREVFITTSMPLHWIYLGARFGWTPLRIQGAPGWSNPNERYVANYYDSINAAISFTAGLAPESVPFFSRFVMQLEGVYNYDLKTLNAMTLTPGALLKFQAYRQGNMLFSLFGGAYTPFALNDKIAYDQTFPIGWTAGVSFGGKLDPIPGIFFIDLRYSADLYDTYVKADGEGFRRSAVTICIGYEFGIVVKK